MATTTERSRTVPREKAGNPVWRKAPGSLLRHPSLFAALALGAFLVVVSATAYPLFLSASGGALVRSAIDDPTVTRTAPASPTRSPTFRSRRRVLTDTVS